MMPRVLLFTSIALAFAQSARATDFRDIPNPRQQNGGWVADTAEILTKEQETELNNQISRLERANSVEIAVVTVTSTNPTSPKEFATELFNRWKVGKKGQDNGTLVLISTGDRRVEIETGYALEELLPDSKVGDIISTKMLPPFKKGDYGSGIIAGTEAISKALAPWRFSSSAAKNDNFGGWILGMGGLLGIGFTFFISRPSRPRKYILPQGESQLEKWDGEYRCSQCKGEMERRHGIDIAPYLTSPQRVAQNIGSTVFEGWICPKCSGNRLHLMSNDIGYFKYTECPRCKERTALYEESIISQPTTSQTNGKKLIVETCQCDFCDYQLRKEIPILPHTSHSAYGKQIGRRSSSSQNNLTSPSSNSSWSNSDSSSSWSNSDSSSSWSNSDSSSSWSNSDSSSSCSNSDSSSSWSNSDSSSSWSNSDFGGGSSGGGGAGDSW